MTSCKGETFSFIVRNEKAGKRLDLFLAEEAQMSRTRVQHLLAEGHVTLQESSIQDTAIKVREGQVFSLFCPAPNELALKPETIDFEIVYEDKHLIVLNKPPQLVVHPGPGHETGTLVHGLLAHCGETLSGIGGVKRPGIVHRLDKGTSGLLVVAKDDHTHQGLSSQFADRTLSRVYHAFVWGIPSRTQGVISLPIGRHPAHRQKQAVIAQGRSAVTHYHVLKILGEGHISQIECRLETGRTHQIRVHLQALKHSLIGDPLYGKTPGRLPESLKIFLKSWPANRPALHAKELSFKHPTSGKSLHFDSQLPKDLESLELFCRKL